MNEFDLPQDLLVAGRRSALEIVLAAMGAASTDERRKQAGSLANRIDEHLNAEASSQKVHPSWVQGLEEIQQALQRIADA